MPTERYQSIQSAAFFSNQDSVAGSRKFIGSIFKLNLQSISGNYSLTVSSEVDACQNSSQCVGYVSTQLEGTSLVMIGITLNSTSTIFFIDSNSVINRSWPNTGDNSIKNLIFVSSLNIVITSPKLRSRSFSNGVVIVLSPYNNADQISLIDYDPNFGLLGFDSGLERVSKFNENTLATQVELNSLRGFRFVTMKIVRNLNYLIACTSQSCIAANIQTNSLFPATVDNLNVLDYSLVVDSARTRYGFIDTSGNVSFSFFFLDLNNTRMTNISSGNNLQSNYTSYQTSYGGTICTSADSTLLFTGLANQATVFSLRACVQPCLICDTNNPSVCLACPTTGNYSLLNNTCLLQTNISCDSTCSICYGPASNQCLSCPDQRVWNSTTHTCTYACPSNCIQCLGSTTADCSVCAAGYGLINGACSPCKTDCMSCEFENRYSCSYCYSDTSVLFRTDCIKCNTEADFNLSSKICSVGDETTAFLDWNFKAYSDGKMSYDQSFAIYIKVTPIDSNMSVSYMDVFRLFLIKLERKDVKISKFNDTILVQSTTPLKGQSLVQIEMSLGNNGNLLRVEDGINYRFVNRTRSILFGAMNATIFGDMNVDKTAAPVASAIGAVRFLSLSGSFCQANVGSSLLNLIQVIEVYGKLYFTPSYFSPLLNISLKLIQRIGDSLQIDDSWLNDKVTKRTRFFFKLSENRINSNILSSIPVQVFLYLVLMV